MEEGQATAEQQKGQAAERAYPYYGVLIALYNVLFGGFLFLYRRSDEPLEKLTTLDLAMLGLSTLRMAKLVSEDEVTAVLRKPVVEERDGQRRPAGRGFRWSIGRLVLCPNCTGTWIAALLTYALHLWPRNTRPFLAVMSASGISQASDALLSLVYTDRDVLEKKRSRRPVTKVPEDKQHGNRMAKEDWCP